MKSNEDLGGHRVIVVNGPYKSKKGFVSIAGHNGVYVDLDYKPLRLAFDPKDLVVLDDKGNVDKKGN